VSDEPLVSVLVPTYERPRYLRETLASAVAQSWRNLEIIVHDNASPTDPAPLVASFADRRIALYRNGENVGVARNIALGLKRCRGKYVAILGDDDLWEPEFVAALASALERHSEAVIAFCDHGVIDGEGRGDEALSDRTTGRYGRDRLAQGLHRPFGEIALVRRAICVMSGALMRRDAADWSDLPAEVSIGCDLYLAYLAARSGGACYYVPRRLMQYRYHDATLSTAVAIDVETSICNARAAVYYWNRFLRERGLGGERYFEMKRGLNALRLVALLARRGKAASAAGEFMTFVRDGFIRPRTFLDLWRRDAQT
jgi:glycosyltransferase involved in cell wall biosynthesis